MALRCFISVELPSAIKQDVSAVANALRKSDADIKWITPENLHITLKFLGNTEESLVPDIIVLLRKKLSPYPPFYIRITGAGCFPDKRHPKILWAGVEDSDSLQSLQEAIEDAMAGLGYPREKKAFSPHLTLGRVRSQKRINDVLRRLEEFREVSFGAVEITSVSLMKSELKPAGAAYSTLAEIPFVRRNDVE